MAGNQLSQWQILTAVEKFTSTLLAYILSSECPQSKLVINSQTASAFYLGFPPGKEKKAFLYFSPQAKLRKEEDLFLAEIQLVEGILVNELLGLACERLNQLLLIYSSNKDYVLETEFREGGLLVCKRQK